MSKYYGKIGFAISTETEPYVYSDVITERPYFGDVIRNTRRWENGERLNANLNINNEFSIVADPFAYENFHSMRYLTYMGVKWIITSVEVQYPRLILSVGGEYNEDTGTAG